MTDEFDVGIASACRTAIGAFMGALSELSHDGEQEGDRSFIIDGKERSRRVAGWITGCTAEEFLEKLNGI